jgi:hypothetical protein
MAQMQMGKKKAAAAFWGLCGFLVEKLPDFSV